MAYVIGRCLLRQRLKQAGMTQKDLADRINVSPQMINDYVKKRIVMGLENARTISEAIGCDIIELYEWEEVSPAERKQRR